MRRRTSAIGAALLGVALLGVANVDARIEGSARGVARTIAAALLARPLPAQLLKVRCERAGPHVDCGLIVQGVKFHRPIDRRSWDDEVAGLIEGAYAAAPQVDEVDCWATVPLSVGEGAVVSGDTAVPTSVIVFSITVPRAGRGSVRARLASGAGVFWDPAFRAALAKGTSR